MQKYTINLTIIINATILTYLLNCNKRIEKNIRDNDISDRTKQQLK